MTRYTVSCSYKWWRIRRWVVWREVCKDPDADFAVWHCTPAARRWTEASAYKHATKLAGDQCGS